VEGAGSVLRAGGVGLLGGVVVVLELPELPMPVPEAPVPVLLLSRSQAANAVPATIATTTAMILLFIAISPVR
jgi:hypothetical protein